MMGVFAPVFIQVFWTGHVSWPNAVNQTAAFNHDESVVRGIWFGI